MSIRYEFVRTDAEIQTVYEWAKEGQLQGSHFWGMKYEDGLLDMLEWLTDRDADPIIE